MNRRVLFICSFIPNLAGVAFFVACLSVVVGSPLSGQEFRIGFLGGTPITSNFVRSTSVYSGDTVTSPSIFTAESGPRSFLAGMSLEALISSRFSIEGNVLHRNLWANLIYTLSPGSTAASTTTNRFIASTTWEFPVLLKYTMGANRWPPFVEGGVSFRSLERTGAPGPSRHGLTGGAGVPIEFGRIQPRRSLLDTLGARRKQWLLRRETGSVGIRDRRQLPDANLDARGEPPNGGGCSGWGEVE